MGLRVRFTPQQLGYPLKVSQEMFGQVMEVEVDYSFACMAFVETFLENALALVPVDTGYLRSTIDAGADMMTWECWAHAEAEYAEYVEYGTSHMRAQPYFEPALEKAMDAFAEWAPEAVGLAEEILGAIAESVLNQAYSWTDAFFADTFGPMSLTSTFTGGLIGMGMLYLMFPLFLGAYALLDQLGIALGMDAEGFFANIGGFTKNGNPMPTIHIG